MLRGADGGQGRDARWWLAAYAKAGLACLSQIFRSVPGAGRAALAVAPAPVGRAQLRRPWPWAAVLVAGAIFALNVEWNAQHHWVTFARQASRIVPRGVTLRYLPEFLAGQFVLLNPLIAVFVARGLRARARPSGGADLALPLASSAPFAAYLLAHSLHARVEAHWPSPLYPVLAIVAAIAAQPPLGRGLTAARSLAAPLGLVLGALALAHLALPATDIPGLPGLQYGPSAAGPARRSN